MNAGTKAVQAGCEEVPPRLAPAKRQPVVIFILVACGVLAGAVLYFFNPAESAFYPGCTFYKTTGLLCPGCGSLRAMHQMLHGNIGEALRYNALLVLSIPLGGAWLGIRKLQHRSLTVKPRWLWIGFGILILFGVLRNLPLAHTHGLAPP